MADGDRQYEDSRGRALIGNIPVEVMALSGLLALVFAALFVAPAGVEEAVSEQFGLSPARLFAGGAAAGGLSSPIVMGQFLVEFPGLAGACRGPDAA